MTEKMKSLSSEAEDLVEEIEEALDNDSKNVRRLVSIRDKVEAFRARYRAHLDELAPADREGVERTVGRKVMDLARLSGRLPLGSTGSAPPPVHDNSFFATREGKSSRQPVQIGAGARKTQGHSVGGEVDAYCSPCEGIHTHTILAVVDGEPVKVTCQACKSTHKYRTGPAKPKAKAATVSSGVQSNASVAADRQNRERAQLVDELRAATPREFNPKERYRVGEIISHPELGRGKVESVQSRSLLVQFAAGRRLVKLG